MSDVQAILKRNLEDVRRRIADACRRAGRQPDEVTLVAVTKTVDVEIVRILHRLGVTNFGESRPQELWRKAAGVPEVRWHLVGHLQRNKVEDTLPLVCLIHSVDSIRLLEAIENEAQRLGRKVDVLLEFNLSGESSKHGFQPNDQRAFQDLVGMMRGLRSVPVRGLMTMAALSADREEARPTFKALSGIRRRMLDILSIGHAVLSPPIDPGHDLKHLSMGMTNDFEVAIEEGATLVRIGTALFRGLGR